MHADGWTDGSIPLIGGKFSPLAQILSISSTDDFEVFSQLSVVTP
jgi:hypothetical protein